MTDGCDIAIIGGGLAGGLIALALAEKRPELDVQIIEPGATLGGNHIWSFFDSDVSPEHRWLVEPLVCHRWEAYDIAFPTHRRTLNTPYNSVTSERLDAVVRAKLLPERIVRASVVAVEPNRPQVQGRHIWHFDISLDTGRQFAARQVIDARGPGDLTALEVGWQKFVGLELHVPEGHGLKRPLVMDATVEQLDGYRFIYCLPFDDQRLFIEDTYYSDTPDLGVARIRERILAYAASRGWHTNGGGREETGVLPVVIGGDFEAYWNSTGLDIAKAGMRAGLFHPVTGYSLPDAVRHAAAMPELMRREGVFFGNASHRRARRHWRRSRFYRLLNAMLFRAAEPHLRYMVLERFYRLSPILIGRFYAGQSTLTDKLRILSGKPPVPIGRAIMALLGKSA